MLCAAPMPGALHALRRPTCPAPLRTRGVCVGALHKLELAGRVDDEVLGPAAQVHQVQAGGKQELRHKVAIGH